MSTQLPVHLASLEHRPIETPPARLSRRLSVILIGALSVLCWAILLVALAVWEFA
jgi:hypothetical protein